MMGETATTANRGSWSRRSHMTPDQAAESLLDCFKRAVRQELELLEVECVEDREVN